MSLEAGNGCWPTWPCAGVARERQVAGVLRPIGTEDG
jgi:hypothetical protein